VKKNVGSESAAAPLNDLRREREIIGFSLIPFAALVSHAIYRDSVD